MARLQPQRGRGRTGPVQGLTGARMGQGKLMGMQAVAAVSGHWDSLIRKGGRG